ncbi:hypothetical protein [Methylovirgula sp. HY1]|uniref:hypothetical protein n=1 Tax=Methylovirgula sp. HY1 TaxID=2822761 RepID=UPI001C5AFA34|nr:hypothetical protein [Methylovirgula sp. HY1]QXX74222.1 hypothetical protein MHY1_01032 [Methylovirgula sp. HY1]
MFAVDALADVPLATGAESGDALSYTLGAAPGSFVLTGNDAAFVQTGGFLGRGGFLSYQDFLGAAAAAGMKSWVEVNIGQPDGFGGVIWGGWQKFTPGNYRGQYVDWRFWAQAPSTSIVGALQQATAQCSVPNRIDNYLNVAVPTTGLVLTFHPANNSHPAPFNKGPCTAAYPNGEPAPAVQVTFNNQSGDVLIISALTLASVTLQVLNAGVGVARTLAAVTVQGF